MELVPERLGWSLAVLHPDRPPRSGLRLRLCLGLRLWLCLVPDPVPEADAVAMPRPLPVVSPPGGQGETEAVPPESEVVVPEPSSGSREGPVSQGNVSLPNQDSAPSFRPIRRRIVSKTGPDALHRPPAMREQDFVDMMRAVVPQLLQEATADSTMSSPNKRAPEFRAASEEPPSSRIRTEEALSVECLTQRLS